MYTASFHITENYIFYPHNVFASLQYFWQQSAVISQNSFIRFLVVMEMYFSVWWNLSRLCISSMSFGIHMYV